MADPEKLVRAVERDRGLMETFLDFVRGLKNRIAIRLSGSERAMLDEAERTLVNLLRGEAGSVAGEKYSFVRATDAEQIARAQELEAQGENAKTIWSVPFPVSWTVKMKKKQKETQDILSYHTQAAGCSDKARAKASGGRQPIEECGRTGL